MRLAMLGDRRILSSLLLLLCFLAPQSLSAQVTAFINPEELTLTKLTQPLTGTSVNSSAKAAVYSAGGQRLTTQIILGHSIADINTQTKIYEKRVVSETGEASTQGAASGIADHCYEAGMAAHVNAYNLHEIWSLGPVCADANEPRPKPDVPKENCPVLLDLEQDGFHLSGPDPAVPFDIDADGTPDQIAWTQAGEDDAFLCWDRNRNGMIDDGRELFGYSTPLLSGSNARVGYQALAELDEAQLGGNRDGKVNSGDRMFRELCTWIDANRDGVSQPSEIHTLDQVGVVSLEYSYRTTRVTDPYGNLFRYVSQAEMRTSSGGVRSWPTFDVVFGEAKGAD
ncbi:MAG TPA: hypothetical protein VHC97_27280 [Thermoanaerobaculia bacterium]|jgi:hypothetical protein|nr:hypothetical protein [Thermoanaerobaculia bacterium]